MKNQFVDIFKYTKAFYSYAGWRVWLVFLLSALSAALESVGLFALIPLLGMFVLGGNDISKLSHLNSSFFGTTMTNWGSTLIENFIIAHSLLLAGLAIIFLFILKAITYFASLASIAYLRGQLLTSLKSILAESYSYVTHSSYIKKNAGRYINTINSQVERALQGFQGVTQISSNIISGIVYFIFSWYVNWRFAAIMLLIAMFLAKLFQGLNSHVKELSSKNAQEAEKASKLTLQLLQAHKYLISTAGTNVVLTKVIDSVRNYSKHQINSGVVSSITLAIREPLGIITVIGVLLIYGLLFPAPLNSSFISAVLLYRGFQMLMSVQLGLQGTLNFAGDIENIEKEILWSRANIEKNGTKKLEQFKRDVVFKDVSFRYDARTDAALKNINIRFLFGKKTAIVGKSGSGKSSLIDLLTLVHEPMSGDILIDGVCAREAKKSSWRKQLGYVGQEVVLFDDTIANNISLWCGDFERDFAIRAKIKKAAKVACIDDFIESLPNKYLTVIGDRGVNLSGGQRQRIAMARELFKEPRFLVLDEATNALDSLTEKTLIDSLDRNLLNCSIIIVAHRYSSIREADNIYVLEKGAVIESGTYAELSANQNSKFSLLLTEGLHRI